MEEKQNYYYLVNLSGILLLLLVLVLPILLNFRRSLSNYFFVISILSLFLLTVSGILFFVYIYFLKTDEEKKINKRWTKFLASLSLILALISSTMLILFLRPIYSVTALIIGIVALKRVENDKFSKVISIIGITISAIILLILVIMAGYYG